MSDDKKSYYAIIPANVRYDKRLTANAKLLYGEITALCNEQGFCWASNDYFASLYEVSKQSISHWIKQLCDYGYIKSTLIYKDGSKEIKARYLTLLLGGTIENYATPTVEKFKDNTTLINTTMNNTIKEKETPENPASPPEKLYPSETHTLADLLSELHTQNIDPGYRHCSPTQNQRWAGDIEKLNRLDGRSFQDIEKAIRWIKTPGQFWADTLSAIL